MTSFGTDAPDNAMNAGESTTYLVHLSDGGTAAAQWVVGTEENGIGFFAEFGRPAPGAVEGAEPDQDVADWVAESLGVTGVELELLGEDRWSVTIVS